MNIPKKQESYRVIYCDPADAGIVSYSGEYEDRKSVFIANITKVESEEEVFVFLEEMRKRYPEACSHAYAYIIGQKGELFRCNDNGEPSGTAGRPMLDVLNTTGIRGVLAVVSRYYGGTKLGTGGLIRAYTNAVQAALQACPTAMMKYGKLLAVETDYNGIGKIQYYMKQQDISPKSIEYTDKVLVTVLLPDEAADHFTKEVTDLTAGKSKITVLEELFYPDPE